MTKKKCCKVEGCLKCEQGPSCAHFCHVHHTLFVAHEFETDDNKIFAEEIAEEEVEEEAEVMAMRILPPDELKVFKHYARDTLYCCKVEGCPQVSAGPSKARMCIAHHKLFKKHRPTEL